MDLQSIKDLISDQSANYVWTLQVFGIVFVTLLLSVVQRRIVKRLIEKAHDTANVMDNAFLEALQGPLRGLLWIVGLGFAAGIVGARTDATIFNAVTPMLEIGVIVMLAWFLSRLVDKIRVNYLAAKDRDGERVDRSFVDATVKLLRASVVITAILIMLQTLGFSISGVLAFGGVGGIAVGFAARDLIANLFGGLTVYLDRPFTVGDWIRSPDRQIEGVVEDIGWRRTVIRTFEKRPLYVPNAVFTTISVENPSRMSHRRINETIGVRYDDLNQLPGIVTDIRRMLKEHPDIDETQTLMVNLNEFSDSSVDFFIYTFTHTTVWTEFHEVKERVLVEIANIIAAHGAEMAYPTTTMHFPGNITIEPTPAGAGVIPQPHSS